MGDTPSSPSETREEERSSPDEKTVNKTDGTAVADGATFSRSTAESNSLRDNHGQDSTPVVQVPEGEAKSSLGDKIGGNTDELLVAGETSSTAVQARSTAESSQHIQAPEHVEEEPKKGEASSSLGDKMRKNTDGKVSGRISLTTNQSRSTTKCSKCNKRSAREGCTQVACLQCCSDVDECETHKKPRQAALLKEKILAGTTTVQQLAAMKRKMKIPTGRFREPGFLYQGDTVVIWDLKTYASNPKWREEAIRKSTRRNRATANDVCRPKLKNSRKRFHRIMSKLYQESLKADVASTK